MAVRGKLSKRSLKDQVYELVKSRILDLEYKCGEEINLNALAKELGVSNTPIREAMSVLENEGLITLNSYSTPHVVKFDSDIFRETWDAVLVLLLGGYELCVSQNRLSHLITLMSESIDYQREIVNTADNAAFARAVIAVDTSVVEVCNNRRLSTIYRSTFDTQFLMVYYDYETAHRDRMSNIHEHEIILNAISAGQHDLVRELFKQHYDRCIQF